MIKINAAIYDYNDLITDVDYLEIILFKLVKLSKYTFEEDVEKKKLCLYSSDSWLDHWCDDDVNSIDVFVYEDTNTNNGIIEIKRSYYENISAKFETYDEAKQFFKKVTKIKLK